MHKCSKLTILEFVVIQIVGLVDFGIILLNVILFANQLTTSIS